MFQSAQLGSEHYRVDRKKNLEKRGVLNPGKLHRNRF